MKLKADFVRDWHDILKDILANYWGMDISGINEDNLPVVYFNGTLTGFCQYPDPKAPGPFYPQGKSQSKYPVVAVLHNS